GVDTHTPFELKYNPDHPAANAEGYVKMPNVNSLIEVMDVREAQRSYEANLGMMDQARSMVMRTIDLLRS
ncbi:MAG: flagellar basal body rod protein FlgC, partial [bacterium]|nr:flagellar basal body rod protein FlgC [bacterium]